MSCLSYFYQTSLKYIEHGFLSFKRNRGCLRIPHGTLKVSSSYRSDILTDGYLARFELIFQYGRWILPGSALQYGEALLG